MIYSKVRNTFYTAFAGLTLIAIASGCSAKTSSTSEIPEFDDSLYAPYSENYSDDSLPSNLFDTTTTSDPVPTTSSTTYQPISYAENQCLTNDLSFFGGYSSMGYTEPYSNASQSNMSCYTANSTQSFWDLSTSMIGAQDYCLQQSLAMIASNTSSEADLTAAGQVAELILVRCMRYQYNRAAEYGNWNPAQQQVYNAGDYSMYMMLQAYGQ